MPAIPIVAAMALWVCCVRALRAAMPAFRCANLPLKTRWMPNCWLGTKPIFAASYLNWCTARMPPKLSLMPRVHRPKNGALIWCCLWMDCPLWRWSWNQNSNKRLNRPKPSIKKPVCPKTPIPISQNHCWPSNVGHWCILPWVNTMCLWRHSWRATTPISCHSIAAPMMVARAMMCLRTSTAMPQSICGMKSCDQTPC